MQLENKKILVVGLGATGEAVSLFCNRRGAEVTATDIGDAAALKPSKAFWENDGIKKEIGFHDIKSFENADMIVVSPGVPHTIREIEAARAKGVKVVGEIELASRFIKTPIIAVTGTNGKTTTVTLMGEMLKADGKKVFVGGNIGNPLIEYADMDEKADWVVAEISSFQLDTIETFRPNISVLLNISEDHLDRYDDFDAYVRSKARIFENQTEDDVAILNRNDSSVMAASADIKSGKTFFSPLKGADNAQDSLFFEYGDPDGSFAIDLRKVKLLGAHNADNISAAVMTALMTEASPDTVQNVAYDFKGLPHRVQHVDDINGVSWYNDSKATNVDAVKAALECFKKPVVLIMGGLDKGGRFGPLRSRMKNRVKRLVVMGQARGKITKAFEKTVPTVKANTMEEAVAEARKAAFPGDVVLLSPGCASFDMFKNYAERGEVFGKAVAELKRI